MGKKSCRRAGWYGKGSVLRPAQEVKEPVLHTAAQRVELRQGGKIPDTFGVLHDIVEFFARALAEGKEKEPILAGVMERKDLIFGRGAIAVGESCFGIAGGPAFRGKIVHIQIVFVTDTADGISEIPLASEIMFFASEEGDRAFGIDLAAAGGE